MHALMQEKGFEKRNDEEMEQLKVKMEADRQVEIDRKMEQKRKKAERRKMRESRDDIKYQKLESMQEVKGDSNSGLKYYKSAGEGQEYVRLDAQKESPKEEVMEEDDKAEEKDL